MSVVITCPIRHSEESDMSSDSILLKIARASLITGSATMIASLLGLAKSKSTALKGTGGIGPVAQFTIFLGLCVGIAAQGLSLGAMKYVSRYLRAGNTLSTQLLQRFQPNSPSCS